MPWIHVDDVAGMYVAALDDAAWSGPVNASAPEPVTNREFSKALGRALHRPAVLPVPGLALKALYGEMAEIVTEGQRAVPRSALELGYEFEHPDLDEALRAALARRPAASVAGGAAPDGGALALTAVVPSGSCGLARISSQIGTPTMLRHRPGARPAFSP